MTGKPDREFQLHIRIGAVPSDDVGGTQSPQRFFMQVSAPISDPIVNRSYLFRLPESAGGSALASEVSDLIEKAVTSANPADRKEGSQAFECAQRAGAHLYNALWCNTSAEDNAAKLLTLILELSKKLEYSCLVLLQFEDRALHLSTQPWETMNFPGWGGAKFLITVADTAIARYVPAGEHWLGVSGHASVPLKLLVAGSAFDLDGAPDAALRSVIKREDETLRKALSSLIDLDLVRIKEFLLDPSPDQLRQAMKGIDALHYIGHGGFDRDRGEYIILRQQGRKSGTRAYWRNLQQVVFDPSNAKNLRLVVLNACELESQARVATGLARAGVPAVVAMRAKIGMDVISDEECFTETFYTEIAKGEPIHVAYSRAVQNIYVNSPVEAFVPTLVLGSLRGFRLVDPNAREAQAIRKESADRRKRLWSLSSGIRSALEERDYDALEAALRVDVELAHEPRLQEVLGQAAEELCGELERLQDEGHWFEAQRLCPVLQAVAELMPEDRRPSVSLEEIDARVEELKRQRRQEIADLVKHGKWKTVTAKARSYLEDEPQNDYLLQQLEKAEDMLQIGERIEIYPPTGSAADPLSLLQSLLTAKNWDEAAELADRMLQGLADTEQQDDFMVGSLFATAQLHRQMGDWSSLERVAREMLTLNPRDASAKDLLKEALHEQGQASYRAQRWGEAEAKLQELIALQPRDRSAREDLHKVWLDQVRDAKRRFDWETVQAVSQRILASQPSPAIRQQAERLKDEADDLLRVMARITLL